MYAPPHSAVPDQNPPPASHWPPYPPPPPSSTSQGASAPPQPNGTYYPSSAPPPTTLPPLSEHRPDMLHQPPPPPPAPYAYPPPRHDMHRYHPPPPTDPYRPPPHPYPQHPQPAPRQRTAIACRYCRRRKIRCSGFDSSEDGRCTNCSRFSQECVFTPVSAQTQAFVPAHAVYRNGGAPPTQLYGAYGQPLPPPHAASPDLYGRSSYHLPNPTGPYAHQAPPPPAASSAYSSAAAANPSIAAAPAPAPYDDRNGVNGVSRKRPAAEPHTPTLPPPNPGPSSALPRTLAPELNHDYTYPDQTAAAPASTSYQPPPASTTAQQPAQAYYTSQAPPRRTSPVLAPPYNAHDTTRTSSSPSTSAAGSTPGASYSSYTTSYSTADTRLQPPATSLPIRNDGRSPPPPSSTPLSAPLPPTSAGPQTSQASGNRPSMSISSLVGGDGASPGDRNATDAAMLRRLGG